MTKRQVGKLFIKQGYCVPRFCAYCPCCDDLLAGNDKCRAHNGVYVQADKCVQICKQYVKGNNANE